MKKIMMIAAIMLLSVGAFAQNEVGQLTLQPKVGINLAKMTGDLDTKTKIGLVAGVEAEYGIAENFGLAFGALYSMEGFKGNAVAFGGTGASAYMIEDVKYNLDYINIPILAQFYPVKGLAIKAGVQPAFNVRHKTSSDNDAADKKDIENIKSFNFSIPVGLSYEISDFVIDARYNIGVTTLVKEADQGRNSTFTFTLGYKFAL